MPLNGAGQLLNQDGTLESKNRNGTANACFCCINFHITRKKKNSLLATGRLCATFEHVVMLGK